MPQKKKPKKQLANRTPRRFREQKQLANPTPLHFREQTRPPLIGEGAYYGADGRIYQSRHSALCKNTTTVNCAVCKVPVCYSCGFKCEAFNCFIHFCHVHEEYAQDLACPHTTFPDQSSKNEATPKIENSSQLSLSSHSAMNHEDEKLEDSHDLQLKKTKTEEVKTKLRKDEQENFRGLFTYRSVEHTDNDGNNPIYIDCTILRNINTLKKGEFYARIKVNLNLNLYKKEDSTYSTNCLVPNSTEGYMI